MFIVEFEFGAENGRLQPGRDKTAAMRRMRAKFLQLAAVATIIGGVGGCKSKPEAKPDKAASEKPTTAEGSTAPAEVVVKPLPAEVTQICEMLPSDAQMLAHIDLKAVGGSPLWARNRARMDKEPDTRRTLEAMEACEVPFAGLQSLDIALAPTTGKTAIIVRGTGVGDPAKLSCIRTKLASAIGDDDFLIEEQGGAKVLKLKGDRPGDEMYGHLPAADTIVLATSPWTSWGATAAAATGKGKGACTGGLNPALARVKADQSIWFAGLLPAEALPELANAGASIEAVTGSLGLADGLAIELQIAMPDAEQAKSMQTLVKAQLDQLAAVAEQMGAPKRVLDSIKLTSEGPVLGLTAAIDMEAIEGMEKVMAASLAKP